MSRVIIGIDQIKIPDKLLLSYNLSSKKVVIDSMPEKSYWITDGIYIDDPVERIKMVKTLKEITKALESKILFSKALFCFSEFKDRDNWRAVRISKIKKDADVYAPMRWGLTGSAEIIMKNGKCQLKYYTKDCITEELLG